MDMTWIRGGPAGRRRMQAGQSAAHHARHRGPEGKTDSRAPVRGAEGGRLSLGISGLRDPSWDWSHPAACMRLRDDGRTCRAGSPAWRHGRCERMRNARAGGRRHGCDAMASKWGSVGATRARLCMRARRIRAAGSLRREGCRPTASGRERSRNDRMPASASSCGRRRGCSDNCPFLAGNGLEGLRSGRRRAQCSRAPPGCQRVMDPGWRIWKRGIGKAEGRLAAAFTSVAWNRLLSRRSRRACGPSR